MVRFGGIFDLDVKQQRLQVLEKEIESDPTFWESTTRSATVLKEKKQLEQSLADAQDTEAALENFVTAVDLGEESEEFREEAQQLVGPLAELLDKLEVECLLGESQDQSDCVMTIQAGAGGTESCDWAEMILRMYLRFADKQGWETTLHSVQDGDEAGIKSAIVEISGAHAFGMLKSESGVHRLVRISPFDSSARRHTSFASVFCSPVVDDAIEVAIDPADLRIDTYRASGAGGQHVNRTDSAVRITHAPSGIVVQCQSQRSQHQNRDTAMKLLRTRLHELELEKRRAAQQEVEASKAEIGFGSQIRSYVLHPQKQVKDHRTQQESFAPMDVLDGDLQRFVKAYLQYLNRSTH